MKKIIIDNRFFFIPYLIVLVACTYFLLAFSKSEIHLAIDSTHNNFQDIIFKYITYFGDGYFGLALIVLFLFINYRWSIITAIAGISSGLVVQLLKKLVFDDISRPSKYFSGEIDLNFVEGVKLYQTYSFPSGHTTTAFCIFLFFALITNNNLLKITFLIFALLVAYSRMYLSQHFLLDVYFGSIIGIAFTIVTYSIVMKWTAKGLEGCLINIFQKK